MGIRPKLRPKDEEFGKIVAAANSGGGDDKPASGGKGGGKSVNPMAKKGSADYKKMQKANAPDSFYGYYDQNTGDYVPWYIDMINGGGANQAGPTFEGGFGTARLAGGLLNAAGVSPYGQDRARAFMPMEAFRGGDDVPLRQAPLAAAPTGGGAGVGAGGGVIDAAVTPVVDYSPYGDAGFYDGMEVNRPVALEYRSMDQAVGGYQYPSMYRPMDRQVGLFQQGQALLSPNLSAGTTEGVAQLADLRLARQEAIGNRPVPQDDMPAILSFGGGERMPQPSLPSPATFSATAPSTAGMTPPSQPNQALVDFNQAMSTVPQMLQGTQIEQMYRDYLLAGNRGTFAQFTGAQ